MSEIAEQIQKVLRNYWNDRMTQQEIGAMFRINQRQVSAFLNAKDGLRSIEAMSLYTLLKMFPNAKIDLTGNGTIHQTGNGSAAVINGGVAIANGNTGSDESKIADEILESDMCDACKIKALKIVRGK